MTVCPGITKDVCIPPARKPPCDPPNHACPPGAGDKLGQGLIAGVDQASRRRCTQSDS